MILAEEDPRVPAYVFRFALGACAGVCVAALPVVFAMAEAGNSGRAPNSPVPVVLSCNPAPQPAVCQAVGAALHQALSDSFPAQIFLFPPAPVPPPASPSTPPSGSPSKLPDNTGLRIQLHITRADSHTIDAHLVWTQAKAAAIIGPTVTLSVLDRPLTATLYPSLAKSLIKNSPLPL